MKDFDEYDVFFYQDGQRVRDTSATVNKTAHPSIYAAAQHLRQMFYTMHYDNGADFFVLINKRTGVCFESEFKENEVE